MKEIVCSICNEEMESDISWVNGRSDSCIVVTPCCNREYTTEAIETLRESQIECFSGDFAELVVLVKDLLIAIDEDDTTNIKHDAKELLWDIDMQLRGATSQFADIYQYVNKTL